MKRLSLYFLLLSAFACVCTISSCTQDYGADIKDAQNRIDEITQELSAFEGVTTNLGALRNVLLIAQAADPIVSVTSVDNGYKFLFKNNGEVVVNNRTAGVSVGWEEDGFYWTLDGQPLKDASGKNAAITISPDFKVMDGKVAISTDGKKTWNALNNSAGDVIQKVEEDASSITVTFLGTTEVVFPKETKMQVELSGDGSTMATTGTAVVDFLLSGKTDSFTVTPLLPEGWKADVVWENNTKGKVIFTAPAAAAGQAARLFFCDGIGSMVASDIDFDALSVDEAFPVMYPVWDAYNIPSDGGSVDVVLVNNQEEYDTALDEDSPWLSTGGTKAVREDVITLVAEPNDSEQMRSALVTFTAGSYVKSVVIWQDGKMIPAGENLSADGTANCYIVSQEGDYYFDATVMGCGKDGILADGSFPTDNAELFPVTVSVYMNQNDVISDVRLNDGKIYFHASRAEGNACILVKNDRKRTVWNWHIWCTDIPKDRTHTNPDNLRFTVLDRNLGATSADPSDGVATHGMYYQWGRKDPYDAHTASALMDNASTFSYAVLYPEYPNSNNEGNWNTSSSPNPIYLWGNPYYGKNYYVTNLTKSIYDPCPVGYMVPPANTFLIFEDESRTSYTEDGMVIRGDYGQTNFFPYAGRINRSENTVGKEMVLWHSCAGRHGATEYGGGTQTRIEKETHRIYWYQGDMRARAIPVRCVKQTLE